MLKLMKQTYCIDAVTAYSSKYSEGVVMEELLLLLGSFNLHTLKKHLHHENPVQEKIKRSADLYRATVDTNSSAASERTPEKTRLNI